EGEAVEGAVVEQRLGDASGDGLGAGGHRRLVEEVVEPGPRQGEAVAGVGLALPARKVDPPAGGADHDHVVDPLGAGDLDAQLVEDLHPAGTDEVAARLVAGERGLVDEGDARPAPGQDEGGDAPGRPGPDHHRVEACIGHEDAYCTCACAAPTPTASPVPSSTGSPLATTCWPRCSRWARTGAGGGRRSSTWRRRLRPGCSTSPPARRGGPRGRAGAPGPNYPGADGPRGGDGPCP